MCPEAGRLFWTFQKKWIEIVADRTSPLILKVSVDEDKQDHVTLFLNSCMIFEDHSAHRFLTKADVLYLKGSVYMFGTQGVLPQLNF